MSVLICLTVVANAWIPSALSAEVKSTDYPTISAAVAACAEKGGGRVVVPNGVYELNGPIHLKSNVELHLEEGARLVFTDDYRAYLPAVRTNWEGIDAMGYSPLVYACGCTNVAVTGKGLLAPRVEGWVPWRTPKGMGAARKTQRGWGENAVPLAERDLTKIEDGGFRPHLLQFLDCKGVRLEGFTIRGSPFWTIHLCRTEDAVVRNLDVSAWSESGVVMNNTDGIDIEMSRNVTVEGCTFRQNDDAIVIKAGRDREGRERGRPCEDVLIRNCTVNAGHTLLGIGSELSAGIRNVRMENCRVDCEVWRLLYIKTNPRRGGFVENITMDGVTARKVTQDVLAISSRVYYGMPGQEVAGPNPQLTRIEGVTMRNVHCDWAKRAVTLLCDPDYPARNFSLENVVVDEVFENFVRVENVDGIKLDVTAKKVHPDAHW